MEINSDLAYTSYFKNSVHKHDLTPESWTNINKTPRYNNLQKSFPVGQNAITLGRLRTEKGEGTFKSACSTIILFLCYFQFWSLLSS